MFSRSLLLVIIISSSCSKQPEITELTPIDANNQGLQILQTALDKHGDIDSESLRLNVAVTNNDYTHIGQSLVSLPPFEKNSWVRTYNVDRPIKKEISTSRQRTSGYDFDDVLVLKGKDGRNYNRSTSTYTSGHSSWFDNLDLWPTSSLKTVLQNRITVRLSGTTIIDSKVHHKIEGSSRNSYYQLFIAKESGLLTKAVVLRTSGTYGDSQREYLFNDYQDFEGLTLPTQITHSFDNSVTGKAVNHYEVTQTEQNLTIENEVMAFSPADYSYRKMFEVIDLGDGVYVIENITNSTGFWSYNIMFVEFSEYVLVTEAAVNVATTEKVIEKIRSVIPDKPIRYVVQSHHHNDHIAGIRGYVAEGVTIVTTKNNTELINKLANASYNTRPDVLSEEPQDPILKIIENKKLKISDGSMTVEVYDIGPTGHADEMLITYLPEKGVLFQADMVNYGEWSTQIDLCKELVATIKELNLSVNTMVGLHGKVMTGPNVDKLLNGEL